MAGIVLLTTLAFVQTPLLTTNPSGKAPAVATDTSSFADAAAAQASWRTSKLVGLGVYNANDESLGSISELLTDPDGHLKAVVIGVGGLLGVGEHLVAVPYDKIRFVDEKISYTAAAGSPHADGAGVSTTTGSNTTPSPPSNPDPWAPDHAVLNATRGQLKAMPEFSYAG
jgi:hypothetical protein